MLKIGQFDIAPLRSRIRVKSSAFAFIIFIGVLINGCAFSEWTSLVSPELETAGNKPSPYYAGINGLTVYSQPTPDSEIVTQLRLYQKVLRTKLVRGYANVTVVESGTTGWVDNGKLIWKLPAKTAPAKIEIKTTLPVTKSQEATPKEPPTSVETIANPKPEKTDTWSKPQPDTLSPSTFNPF